MLVTRRRRMLLFLALALAALFVYLPRTYRTLAVMGDSAELVTAAVTWGVPHPPGYPLFTSVAHLATRLPAFELPFRVHALSALFHAAAVAVVGSIIEGITGSITSALVGAAALALGRIFFLGSLYAEVFPLNDLLFACLLAFAIQIARTERDGAEPTAIPPGLAEPPNDAAKNVVSPRWYVLAAALGLALAHHHMIVLALPALTMLVGTPLWRDARRYPHAMWGPFLCAIALPFLFYALIPLAASRHPVPSWGDVHDLASLGHLVARQDYGGVAHASRRLVDGQLLERLDTWSIGTAQSFGVAGTLLFCAGVLWAFRHERRTALALLAAIFCAGPVFAALNAFDIHSPYRVAFFERFTTMSHIPIAVMVGVGATQLAEWLHAWPLLAPRSSRVATGFVAALAVTPLLGNVASLDMRDNRRGSAYAHDLIDGTPDDALLLLKSDMASQAALFACAVEARCGGRMVLTPGQLWMPWKKSELSRRYPALSLPPSAVPSAARWLAEQSLPMRPVFIHPELIDDVVHGELSILPSLLLFRLYPNERTLRDDLPRFRTDLGDLAEARHCEGCAMLKTHAPETPADAQLDRVYDAALHAHAMAAAELDWPAEATAISRLSKRQ